MIYRVVSYGIDVEFTSSLKDAELAFKDARVAELWRVGENGNATLLRKK